MEPMVSIRGLVKRFGDVSAVAGIELQVPRGEFVALLGPSGCGKTTALRCIAGLEEINEGEIIIDGQLVSAHATSIPPEKRGIGMVFQSYAIWPHMTVQNNVAFGLKLRGVNDREIDERVDAILSLVGLTGLGGREASQLSGGQQQRVALARALIVEPKVLLFDEPLSNLDAKLRERMRFELRQLQQRLGITSIYVTHDQEEAMVIADRILLMQNGKIIQAGGSREIYNRPVNRFAAEFVGRVNMLPGIVIQSDKTGTKVRLTDDLQLQSEATGFLAGQSVTLLLRPEEIGILDASAGGANEFPGRVKSSVFLGSYSDVYLQVNGVELNARLSPPREWLPQQEVRIRIPSAKIIVIANEDPEEPTEGIPLAR